VLLNLPTSNPVLQGNLAAWVAIRWVSELACHKASRNAIALITPEFLLIPVREMYLLWKPKTNLNLKTNTSTYVCNNNHMHANVYAYRYRYIVS